MSNSSDVWSAVDKGDLQEFKGILGASDDLVSLLTTVNGDNNTIAKEIASRSDRLKFLEEIISQCNSKGRANAANAKDRDPFAKVFKAASMHLNPFAKDKGSDNERAKAESKAEINPLNAAILANNQEAIQVITSAIAKYDANSSYIFFDRYTIQALDNLRIPKTDAKFKNLVDILTQKNHKTLLSGIWDAMLIDHLFKKQKTEDVTMLEYFMEKDASVIAKLSQDNIAHFVSLPATHSYLNKNGELSFGIASLEPIKKVLISSIILHNGNDNEKQKYLCTLLGLNSLQFGIQLPKDLENCGQELSKIQANIKKRVLATKFNDDNYAINSENVLQKFMRSVIDPIIDAILGVVAPFSKVASDALRERFEEQTAKRLCNEVYDAIRERFEEQTAKRLCNEVYDAIRDKPQVQEVGASWCERVRIGDAALKSR